MSGVLGLLYLGSVKGVNDPECTPPTLFRHGEWERVVFFKKDAGGDGQEVRIYEMRMPASFFRVEVLPTPNSVGRMQSGFVLTTGSDRGELAFSIGREVRDGMLGLEREDI